MGEPWSKKCWAVCQSDGRGGLRYLQPNGQAAVADKPETLSHFDAATYLFARLSDGKWPVDVALALSLDVAGVVCIDLFAGWDEWRNEPVEGAALWLERCAGGHAELCWPNEGQRAIRLIAKARLPENGYTMPPRVRITTTGFITLTLNPVPAPWRARWQIRNDGEDMADISEALATLLAPTDTY